MKILHVIGAFDKKLGGTYSAILSVLNIENILGYNNEVLSLITPGQEYDAEILKDKLHLFNPSFPRLFSYSKDANSWLSENIYNFNLVIVHEVWSALAIHAAFLADKIGLPYVIWPHGSLDPFDLQKKKLLKKQVGKLIISRITKKAGAICCTSELEKELLETYNPQKNNIEILPLPINYEVKGSRETFRADHNIVDNELVFLFLSRVDYKKGLDLFLYAYKEFIQQTEAGDTKLLIAGKGSPAYEAYIQNIIKELGLSKNVIVSGFLTGVNKANAYAGADCFILPSMNENYGISVVEALQSGLPVLISDNVYIWKNIIPDGGWVCKHEVNSILQKLLIIYSSFKNDGLADKNPVQVGETFKANYLISDYANFYGKILYPQVKNILEIQLSL